MLSKSAAPGEKRVLHKFRIKEISGVDRPAQEPAHVVLLKRMDEGEDSIEKAAFMDALEGLQIEQRVRDALQDMWMVNDALCRSVREIIENPEKYPDPVSAVSESLKEFAEVITQMVSDAVGEVEDEVDGSITKVTKTEGGQEFSASDYAYVPDPDKPSTWKLRLSKSPGGEPDARIVGAAVAALGAGFRGNKVSIPAADLPAVKKRVRDAWKKANPDNNDLPQVLKSIEEETPDMTKTRTVEELTSDIEKKDKELAIAKAEAQLNDAEKAYYAKQDDAGKTAFLAMTPELRKGVLSRLTEENPVVYKSDNGEEFRKNDDPRLVTLAKSADEERKVAKREREQREEIEYKKRAKDEIPNLPGDEMTKVALLKAVDGIADETVRKAAQASLKAQNETLAKAMQTLGTDAGNTVAGGAVGQLDTLAKNLSTTEKISYADAYAKVLKTPEGQALYEQTLSK